MRSLNELSLLIEILISLWDLLKLSDEGQLDTVPLLLLKVLPKVDGFLMHSKDKSNDAFIFHLDDIKILDLVVLSKANDLIKPTEILYAMHDQLWGSASHERRHLDLLLEMLPLGEVLLEMVSW